MNKQRVAILILASFGVIATFMPWTSVPLLGSMNGINGKIGKISIVLFLVPLILSLIGDKNKDVKKWMLGIITAFSILVAIIDSLYIAILKVHGSEDENPLGKIIADNTSIGFGVYIAILSGILLPIIAFLMKESNNTAKNISVVIENVVPEKKHITSIEFNDISISNNYNEDDKIQKEDHSRFMPK